jgi:hypothetical protein
VNFNVSLLAISSASRTSMPTEGYATSIIYQAEGSAPRQTLAHVEVKK